ncbi:hypothetical protein T11_10530 [Trichinella zimbabwensis]|uniref:Uncharacterized protein n=1 Tax=Trichinella zimbabwensis TaxID=268475 RepID=A0A0V1G994_9BILA|nr:hypothetical protein T11_10530 [Trichinella zimbabwensis]
MKFYSEKVGGVRWGNRVYPAHSVEQYDRESEIFCLLKF